MLALARRQAALPVPATMLATCSPRRRSSSRRACRSFSILPEASAAALRTSRTPSRASLAVSRIFCEAVDAVFMSLLRTLDEPRCPDKYIGTEKFHSIRKFNVVGGKQMVEYHKADDRQRH